MIETTEILLEMLYRDLTLIGLVLGTAGSFLILISRLGVLSNSTRTKNLKEARSVLLVDEDTLWADETGFNEILDLIRGKVDQAHSRPDAIHPRIAGGLGAGGNITFMYDLDKTIEIKGSTVNMEQQEQIVNQRVLDNWIDQEIDSELQEIQHKWIRIGACVLLFGFLFQLGGVLI